jgi:hypothetical protein
MRRELPSTDFYPVGTVESAIVSDVLERQVKQARRRTLTKSPRRSP